ncbi:MAG: hypothetical protein AB1782_01520 [Cyanobacteriota bacterium]
MKKLIKFFNSNKITILILLIVIIAILLWVWPNIESAYNEYKRTKVTKTFPKVRTKKLSDNLTVKITRINDLKKPFYTAQRQWSLQLKNGKVLICDVFGDQLFNPEDLTFNVLKENNLYSSGIPYELQKGCEVTFTKAKEAIKKTLSKVDNNDYFTCLGFISPATQLYANNRKDCLYTLNIKTFKLSKCINFPDSVFHFFGLYKLKDGKSLFFSGDKFIANNGTYQKVGPINIFLFDLTTEKLSVIGKTISNFSYIIPLELPNNKLLITGYGEPFNYESNEKLIIEVFDFKTGKSTLKGSFKSNTSYRSPTKSFASEGSLYQLSLITNNIILISGQTTSLYDIKNNKFYNLGQLAMPRDNHYVTKFNNGKILVVGSFCDYKYKDCAYSKYCNHAYLKNDTDKPVSICKDIQTAAEVIEIIEK